MPCANSYQKVSALPRHRPRRGFSKELRGKRPFGPRGFSVTPTGDAGPRFAAFAFHPDTNAPFDVQHGPQTVCIWSQLRPPLSSVFVTNSVVARLNVKGIMLWPNPCRPQDGPRVGGTVGKPLPGVGILVVADDGSSVPTGEKTAEAFTAFSRTNCPATQWARCRRTRCDTSTESHSSADRVGTLRIHSASPLVTSGGASSSCC